MKTRLLVFSFLFWVLSPTLRAQEPADSSASKSSASLDRYIIDAATLVRDGGARSLTEVLISQVPGLLVVPGSGVNGMGSRIRMRGVQSLVADRAPLVLVDGMRVEVGEDAFSPRDPWGGNIFGPEGPRAPGPLRLDDLNSADVESIEVLPGSASSAIYGPGASAGVLLIHTKRGRPGPPRWEGYAQGGVSSASRRWPANFGGVDRDHPDTAFQHGACTLSYQAAGYCDQDFVQQFNPWEQRNPFRTALRRQYGLSVSGGSAWGDYRVSGEFARDAGPYSAGVTSPDPNYHRRLNGRLSTRVRPWSTLELALNAARMSGDLRLPPDLPWEASVAGPSDSAGFDWSRMFRLQSTQAAERRSAIVEARWSPWPWIGVRGLAGFDASDQLDAALWPYSSSDRFPTGSLTEGNTKTRHRTLELVASATGALSSAVVTTTRLGVQGLRDSLAQQWTGRADYGTGFGSPYAGAGRWSRRHSVGYYVDERLEIARKLVLGAAVRHDRFKQEDRSATYPSFTLSWLAHVAADSAPVGQVRLRAGYGSAGPRPFEDVPFIIVPIGTPIPRMNPERTKSAELGLDAALLRDRVGVQLTYYAMRSHVFRLSGSWGYPAINYAPGTISNRGIEATIRGTVLTGSGTDWDVTLSLWGNRNRLTEFDGAPFLFGAGFYPVHGVFEGYPVGGYWALPIQSFADANGDGIIARSEVVLGPNRVWAGTPHPTQGAMLMSEWTLGGSFRAALTLDYRAGHHLFNQIAYQRCLYGTCRAANDPQTPLAEQARAAVAGSGPTTEYFEDADYLKMRDLSVTWYARPRMAAALGARSVALTLTGRNLLTWTGYSGGDPEAGSYGIIQPGFPRGIADAAALPVSRAWVLRLDVAY